MEENNGMKRIILNKANVDEVCSIILDNGGDINERNKDEVYIRLQTPNGYNKDLLEGETLVYKQGYMKIEK